MVKTILDEMMAEIYDFNLENGANEAGMSMYEAKKRQLGLRGSEVELFDNPIGNGGTGELTDMDAQTPEKGKLELKVNKSALPRKQWVAKLSSKGCFWILFGSQIRRKLKSAILAI